jgi:3-isopropylmalate/(R)-2-methylmalate dehydratase large subunit
MTIKFWKESIAFLLEQKFRGRQGQGARTILASPLTAAKVAVEGKIVGYQNLN